MLDLGQLAVAQYATQLLITYRWQQIYVLQFKKQIGEVLINPETREVEKFEQETDWDGKFQHAGCIEEMFDAFTAGKKSATDCTDNYKSMSMVFAALESASKGQKVRVPDDDF